MKKAILAAAIATLVAAPAASANVTIYGQVHVAIEKYDGFQGVWGVIQDDVWVVKSNASRIGFKGTEDLGNGLSVIWKAETTYDFADGSAWGYGLNAYIGLAGDWGTFLYGRHDSPYKMAYYSTGIEMMGDTILDFKRMVDNMHNGSHLDDIEFWRGDQYSGAIAYISPNMNGLTIAGAIVPGANSDGPGGDGLADAVSLAAMYANNGLKLAMAYESNEDGDDDSWLVGASYTMNNMTLAVTYNEDSGMDDGGDHEALLVAGSYRAGNNNFVVKYGDDLDSDSDWVWGIGVEHALSKRSMAYVAYADSEDDDSALSVGMIHKF
ncbi:porin [Solemya velum gill symbiont]|uniref:porin n=1 Tax=Solemya velum gill symbiont TaxID=2340 RepID=UPI0009984BF9|nr:porin [Solemya velum gill symbiont]OOY97877.1 hypothetical protein BOW19_10435 [Solemya velum gill symbiont]OOY99858.1 hypothetical protein BOW20_10435 [Solemya velum gill symbiont]OOZ02234.1 hypothetical protein BOW21_10515 [Solemya velum gill symbiont]OOZ04226.1 hypothetical protein BOW22_10430 [Solemya velum gill symbiont]OOZ06468.1 hypothetical protein BOW23_10435 [Solemya velum gill symbiont]